MNKHLKPRATVDDVRIILAHGPWKSKSGGTLMVPVAMNLSELLEFVWQDQDAEEAMRIPDIYGFRVYTVSDIPKEGLGGNEFHRIRNELLFTTRGSFQWKCEDVYGGTRTFVVNRNSGLWMPPYINHTYIAREDQSDILVMCNTLFVQDDKNTHDTFLAEEFREIQVLYSH